MGADPEERRIVREEEKATVGEESMEELEEEEEEEARSETMVGRTRDTRAPPLRGGRPRTSRWRRRRQRTRMA